MTTRIPDHLTSRRGARIALGIVILLITVLFGLLGGVSAPTGNDAAPADSESARARALLERFPDARDQSLLVVAERADGAPISAADHAALGELAPVIAATTGHDVRPPSLAEDGRAAVIAATLTVGETNAETADAVADLRSALADQPIPGLDVLVTGGPAFGADVTSAFDGANFTLLLVTILIVAGLLIITYRSPILWLIPLAVVAIADQLGGKIAAVVGNALDLQFDTGIVSVLVFGAGTNYALLLISRYREELRRDSDHRRALATAWRGSLAAILASNVTVVLALLTLAVAVIPGTRGLGLTSAAGLIVAVIAVLFVLPPVLAVCGRLVFWPLVPRPGEPERGEGFWHRIAATVTRRPVVSLTSGVLLLGVLATGLFGASIGLTQVEKFRVPSESAAGLEVLAAHFPPGEAQPMFIAADSAHADAVVEKVGQLDGVVRVNAIAEHDGTTKIMVVGADAPGTDASLNLVTQVRASAHAVPGADALVGGAGATDLDARAGNERDLRVVAPLILAVSVLVLLVLTRSVVAPLLLLLVNVASAAAAIGAGAWLSRVLFDQHALDLQVPLLAFLFLVALGIDYTIFLVHRTQTEARRWGTREGTVRAVAATGSVITSGGIVLAGVFAALGVLPLVTLGQLGLIVGLGVIVDALVVRTVIVPALFSLFGPRLWFPQIGVRERIDA